MDRQNEGMDGATRAVGAPASIRSPRTTRAPDTAASIRPPDTIRAPGTTGGIQGAPGHRSHAGSRVTIPLTPEPEARVRGCCAALDPGHVSEEEQARLLADLEAIAHPIRLRLLAALAANPGRVCVCDLEAIVPVKQPTVSHHLRILRKAGLVDSERRGLWAHYRVRRDALGALASRIGLAMDALAGVSSVREGEGT